jgi:hypothetical protein
VGVDALDGREGVKKSGSLDWTVDEVPAASVGGEGRHGSAMITVPPL